MRIACLPGGILHANTYVLHADDSAEAIVIDPTDAELLEACFSEHELRPVAVLLTHGHFDHICGLPGLLRNWQIPVYLHPGDGSMLTDPMRCGLHAFFPGASFEPVNGYEAISDVQELCIADLEIRVLSTPGHSKGSVCYLIDGILFSGDTLFRDGFGRTDLWGGDYAELTASLSRLRKLPADTAVYTGHGASTTIGSEFRV
ncbi:MAG: MBL fold metallo-hydrolase [Clostridia bacterium]|nr:MBL fold metallo-hydrolase [Clostridia bacterium]MBQ8382383.1 MBL fold metallo-hydrolase [Clostridia bacterium]